MRSKTSALEFGITSYIDDVEYWKKFPKHSDNNYEVGNEGIGQSPLHCLLLKNGNEYKIIGLSAWLKVLFEDFQVYEDPLLVNSDIKFLKDKLESNISHSCVGGRPLRLTQLPSREFLMNRRRQNQAQQSGSLYIHSNFIVEEALNIANLSSDHLNESICGDLAPISSGSHCDAWTTQTSSEKAILAFAPADLKNIETFVRGIAEYIVLHFNLGKRSTLSTHHNSIPTINASMKYECSRNKIDTCVETTDKIKGIKFVSLQEAAVLSKRGKNGMANPLIEVENSECAAEQVVISSSQNASRECEVSSAELVGLKRCRQLVDLNGQRHDQFSLPQLWLLGNPAASIASAADRLRAAVVSTDIQKGEDAYLETLYDLIEKELPVIRKMEMPTFPGDSNARTIFSWQYSSDTAAVFWKLQRMLLHASVRQLFPFFISQTKELSVADNLGLLQPKRDPTDHNFRKQVQLVIAAVAHAVAKNGNPVNDLAKNIDSFICLQDAWKIQILKLQKIRMDMENWLHRSSRSRREFLVADAISMACACIAENAPSQLICLTLHPCCLQYVFAPVKLFTSTHLQTTMECKEMLCPSTSKESVFNSARKKQRSEGTRKTGAEQHGALDFTEGACENYFDASQCSTKGMKKEMDNGIQILNAAACAARIATSKLKREQGLDRRGGAGEEVSGRFLWFILSKQNLDTAAAVLSISKAMGRPPKTFSTAGTKDRKASTTQVASAFRVTNRQLEEVVLHPMVDKNIQVQPIGYSDKSIRLGHLKGNFFQIVLRRVSPLWASRNSLQTTLKGNDCSASVNASHSEEATVFKRNSGSYWLTAQQLKCLHSYLSEGIRNLEACGFLNYFGLQRFGAQSIRTYQIGVMLLNMQYRDAVRAILHNKIQVALSFCNFEDVKKNDEFNDASRTRADNGVLFFGSHEHVEEQLVSSLLGGASYAEALEELPLTTLQLYVHSAQAFVFNHLLSRRWKKYGDKVQVGDLLLCRSPESPAEDSCYSDPEGPSPNEEFLEDQEIMGYIGRDYIRQISTRQEAEDSNIDDIVLPLPGRDIHVPSYLGHEFTDICTNLLATHPNVFTMCRNECPKTQKKERRKDQRGDACRKSTKRNGGPNRYLPSGFFRRGNNRGIEAKVLLELLRHADESFSENGNGLLLNGLKLKGGYRRIVIKPRACEWQLAALSTRPDTKNFSLIQTEVERMALKRELSDNLPKPGTEQSKTPPDEHLKMLDSPECTASNVFAANLGSWTHKLNSQEILDFRNQENCRTINLGNIMQGNVTACGNICDECEGCDMHVIQIREVHDQTKGGAESPNMESNAAVILRLWLPPGVYCTMAIRQLLHGNPNERTKQ